MATPRLDDELAKQAADAYRAHGRNQQRAADAIGIPRPTFQNRLRVASERGMLLDEPPAMPGFRISQVSTTEREDKDGNTSSSRSIQQKPELGPHQEIPKGHVVKGVSVLENGDGETLLRWVKTREGELDPLQLAEALRDSFKDYVPAAPVTPAPATVSEDLATLIPCNDWHVNMQAWGKQVGQKWDLNISESTIGGAVENAIERSPASAVCLILGGGDLLHADNKNNTTTGGTPQDVDGRYQKGIDVATRLKVRVVDAALRKHGHVIVRILKGNHDEHASVAVAYFLRAWYRNEPRVTVDVDPSDYFWFRFGLVMLGATHGHQSSNHIAKMPGIMAHRRAKDWGETRHRYVHGFHLHHSAKFATEGEGVISEIHQAPVPQDAWHFGSGFLSGRSIQAITYHRQLGEIGRVRVAILDADEAPPLAPT